MNIYIDFDHTLFNTTLFINDIMQNKNQQLTFLELKKLVKKQNLNLKNYLYPDVIPFLEKYQDKNLILLTHGDYDYQLFKIRESKIVKYFKEIKITDNYKGLLKLDYQKSIFIDDNPKEIESLLKNPIKPLKIIRIKRGKYKDLEQFLDLTVTSLSDINL